MSDLSAIALKYLISPSHASSFDNLKERARIVKFLSLE